MDFSEKFRPKKPEQLVGELQQKIARSFETTEYRKILFIGPSGCGKTTLGMMYAQRFIGNERLRNAVMMVNCGEQTGVDFIREHVIATLNYYPLPPVEKKIFFFDEIHMLSKSAQNSLLIPLESENLPRHTIIIAGTTGPEKLLKTLRSRFKEFELKSPSRDNCRLRCQHILKSEGKNGISHDTIDEIIDVANGNLRVLDDKLEQLLNGTFVPSVRVDDPKSLLYLLLFGNNIPLIKLCQAADRETDLTGTLNGLCSYSIKVLQNKNSPNAKKVLRIFGNGLSPHVSERVSFFNLLLKFSEEE